MSLLILAQRFGSEPRYLMIRGLEGVVGFDSFGRVSQHQVERPFFTISRRSGTYSLIINDSAFSRCAESATAELTQQSVIKGEDFEFKFYITSPYAELLAFTNIDPRTPAGKFSARLRIGPLSLLSPLPVAGHITVGSAPDAGLHIPLKVVAPLALEINCSPNLLQIRDESRLFEISENASCELGSTRLELEILKN